MTEQHPGKLMCQLAKARGWNQLELSRQLGFSDPYVSDLCNGKRGISVEVAIRLERLGIGTTAEWVRAQGDWDTAQKIAALS
jgi:plasmid maintenance system antidote protein VapI